MVENPFGFGVTHLLEPEGWNVLDPDWPQISPKAEDETMVAYIPPCRNENISAHLLVLFQL